MTDATDLWGVVVANYDAAGLLSLTNTRDRAAVAIDSTAGTAAAQSVINLWPMFAQVEYDGTDAAHVEVATFGVIAMLWRRGGTAVEIEKIRWDEVFGDGGLIEKVRRTSARGHEGPTSNSGVSQAAERDASGGPVRGWADRESLPPGYLPQRRSAYDD